MEREKVRILTSLILPPSSYDMMNYSFSSLNSPFSSLADNVESFFSVVRARGIAQVSAFLLDALWVGTRTRYTPHGGCLKIKNSINGNI